MTLVSLLKPEYRIRVEWDEDADLSWAEVDEHADTRAALESGTYGVYGIVVETRCPCCGEWSHGDSLWGIVCDATATGTYRWTTQVGNDYLQEVARNCVAESRTDGPR